MTEVAVPILGVMARVIRARNYAQPKRARLTIRIRMCSLRHERTQLGVRAFSHCG